VTGSIAQLILIAALSSSAIAADQEIYFVVGSDGHVSIDCIGTVPTDFALIKKRLEDYKRAEPLASVDFVVMHGAPLALVRKYRELVVSRGFRFGKSRSGSCN
jgi:hypothetical protein